MPVFESTIVAGDGFEDMNFFVNDKEQLVAQWPNGESNYATWTGLVNENINSGVIKADEMRSKRWQGEKFAYFEGYPSPDYSNERNNITIDGDLIKFKNIARFNLDENHSRRYKVKHIKLDDYDYRIPLYPWSDLTVEQIRKIYAGEYTNWSEVGGANRIINPVTRLKGSGSQTTFESFMGEYEIGRKSPLAITGASIGFSFRYYMDGIVENDAVKMLSLNGVFPSPENIRNRSYPIVAQFYAIYRADNDNINIPVLIDWILSDEGQQLIEESGYIRIN